MVSRCFFLLVLLKLAPFVLNCLKETSDLQVLNALFIFRTLFVTFKVTFLATVEDLFLWPFSIVR